MYVNKLTNMNMILIFIQIHILIKFKLWTHYKIDSIHVLNWEKVHVQKIRS